MCVADMLLKKSNPPNGPPPGAFLYYDPFFKQAYNNEKFISYERKKSKMN
jgi:hypothetical protein